MKQDESTNYQKDQSRATNVSYQTHDQNQLENIIGEIVHHQLHLPYLIIALQQMPKIREQTKLIHEIFLKPALVDDMISFLVNPAKMLKKYSMTADQGRRFVRSINNLMKQNYELYQFFFLGLQQGNLKIDIWFQFLDDPKANTFYPSLGQITEVFLPLLKYEYSSSSMINDYFQKKSMKEKPILIINLFSQELLDRLINFTQYEVIFKVLFTLVIASLEEQEWHKSLAVLKNLCLSALNGEVTSDQHVESIFIMVKEVSNNISKDKHRSIFAFIDAYTQTKLIRCCLNRLLSSFASEQFKKKGVFTYEQQGVIEFNLKIMSEMINIYYLLRKNGIDYQSVQMKRLKTDILDIFNCFDQLINIVRLPSSKIVKFSTGEDIKAVALFRYEWFNLLRMCLLLVKQYAPTTPEFHLQLSKVSILQLIQKYLSENRWNNIMHCLLQKIVCLLINTEFFKNKNNNVHTFLEFLIEVFNNKKFVFLNSTRMTSQGDIHSLYYISRKVANELEKTSTLFNITNEFEIWRKFIIDTVQVYQSKSEQIGCMPPPSELQECERHRGDEDFKVEIDELVSIKQLVKKIQINKKWEIKKEVNSSRQMFRTGSASHISKKNASRNILEKNRSPNQHSKFRVSINEERLKLELAQLSKNKNGLSSLDSLVEIGSGKNNSSHSDSQIDIAQEYNRQMDFMKEE